MKENAMSMLMEEHGSLKPQDKFQQSTVVTYLNTMKRFKNGKISAEQVNKDNEMKRNEKASKVQAARR